MSCPADNLPESALDVTAPQPVLLLIDDSEADRTAVRRLLVAAGCDAKIVEQEGGAEALVWLRRERIPGNTALLIIVALDMPGLSGQEFLAAFAALREQRPDLQPCVVTVLSSSGHPEALAQSARYPFVWRQHVKMPSVAALRNLLRQAALCSTDSYEAIV